jgi:hypothetical protein
MANGMNQARIPILPGHAAHAALHLGNDYYVHQRASRFRRRRARPPARCSATTRSPAVPLPLHAAGHAHGDQHPGRAARRGSVDWLWKEWANVLRVRNDGVPIVGFTWYSLTDQMDWDTRCAKPTAASSRRPLRPRPQPASRRPRLQAADRGLRDVPADAERLPAGPRHSPSEYRDLRAHVGNRAKGHGDSERRNSPTPQREVAGRESCHSRRIALGRSVHNPGMFSKRGGHSLLARCTRRR